MDHHNRYIQANINTETKLETKYWSMWINMSLVSINMVYDYIEYSQYNGDADPQGWFYINFEEDLIEKDCVIEKISGNFRLTCGDERGVVFINITGSPSLRISSHLTPINKKTKEKYFRLTNKSKQAYCGILNKKTKHNCSQCIYDNDN